MSSARPLAVVKASLVAFLSVSFFIAPPVQALVDLTDPALRGPGVPAFGWRLARTLVPRYATWARARLEAQRAAASDDDVSGTEWPLFGSLFFLWGVENLQAAWDAGDHRLEAEPRVFAHDAVDAAAALISDPSQAGWVRARWGRDYLHHQDVFYRMLIIGSLAAREGLLRDHAHLEVLRDQTESLASELDASPTGLLEDYPNETYPGDVLAAWLTIQRADRVLGTDHAAQLARARRGFEGAHLAPPGLPPFSAQPSGAPQQEPRGSGMSWVALLAPELWPATALAWFETYDASFWQERWTAVGFREFARDTQHPEWFVEVDAGPVLAGHGISASAFGVGAARRNGRFDRAFPLACELLATAWALPSGLLVGPSLLSNAVDAPLLGEAAVFWLMTTQPVAGVTVRRGTEVPGFVFIVLLAPLALGLALLGRSLRTVARVLRGP